MGPGDQLGPLVRVQDVTELVGAQRRLDRRTRGVISGLVALLQLHRVEQTGAIDRHHYRTSLQRSGYAEALPLGRRLRFRFQDRTLFFQPAVRLFKLVFIADRRDAEV